MVGIVTLAEQKRMLDKIGEKLTGKLQGWWRTCHREERLGQLIPGGGG